MIFSSTLVHREYSRFAVALSFTDASLRVPLAWRAIIGLLFKYVAPCPLRYNLLVVVFVRSFEQILSTVARQHLHDERSVLSMLS